MAKPPSEKSDIEAKLAKADPALGRVIGAVTARIGRQRIAPSLAKPFEALVRAIVYQSIAAKAAAAIFARLKSALEPRFTPGRVLAMSQSSITAIGLSKAKAAAIRNLAHWFNQNKKTVRALSGLPDEDIVAVLTSIGGIGAWTANVFLIFNLRRLDVMPASDLGIRRGVQLICGLKRIATPREVHDRALLWQPYRSIASIYLWNAVKLKIAPSDLKGRKLT
jgi:DNA-3-methyladenine glycosylase II